VVDLATAATLAATILVAVGGYVAKYWNDLRISERQDRLARLNRQLSEFYGPLYALSLAGAAAFHALAQSWQRSNPEAGLVGGRTWEIWVREIFMPLNRRMVSIVIEKADLLDGDEMPRPLLDLCTHVYAYEAVLKQWEDGDYSQRTSVIGFPGRDLQRFVSAEFPRLKAEQIELIGELRAKRKRLLRSLDK
jgi:hypothetical protein